MKTHPPKHRLRNLFEFALLIYGQDRAQSTLGLFTSTIDLLRWFLLTVEVWIETRLSARLRNSSWTKKLYLVPLPGDKGMPYVMFRHDAENR